MPRVCQVVQHLRTGEVEVLELAAPSPLAHEVLVQTRRSLLSAGTERTLLEFGRAGLIGKARQEPDRVRLLLDRLRTDGIAPTLEAAFTKLDEPLPLGYANVGVVRAVGSAVHGINVGDRVVSNAPHATWARVGANLCARVPDPVSDDHAAFVVPAAIGLQGVRLAETTLGETFGVIGVGLIGLLTVQLLRAAGCNVIAIDLREDRLALAARFGARTVLAGPDAGVPMAARAANLGRELDGVLITAATDSDAPMRDAAQMTRKRGRIILVGVAGLNLVRADFYAKELRFQVSCSYGPGRYDARYETGGQDYPLAFVRWTEQRNFEAVLDLMAAGRLDVQPLITHRFELGQVQQAYEALLRDGGSLGILLGYPEADATEVTPPRTVTLASAAGASPRNASQPGIVMLGAGAYARRFLLPALQQAGTRRVSLIANGSALSAWAAEKFGFEQLSSDVTTALGSADVDAVVIATRHDSHARYVLQSLAAGKDVFVEKPLALSTAEIEAIRIAGESAPADRGRRPLLMVGFNRRFSPLAIQFKRHLQRVAEPKCFVYTVNAGSIASDHWTVDPAVGGGRIVGEACHFIDLLRFLVGAAIVEVRALPIGRASSSSPGDSASITLRFADGSIGTVHYFSQGGRAFPKERLEVFAAGGVLRLDNFRSITSFSWPRARSQRLWRQDKGNHACLQAFVDAVRQGGESPIPLAELIEVSEATLEAARQVQESPPTPSPARAG